jgi:methylenetetrahydrofolate dehydrogenase (NADP+)/methenyltetrahydrofolate cyclohydrolase
MNILSGLTARDARIPALIEKVRTLSCPATLAIIQIGDRSDSAMYVKGKKTFAKKIGAEIRHIHLPETVSQGEVLKEIAQCNADVSIQGIIVQLPLPAHIDRAAMIEAVTPTKDVDGLTTINQTKLLQGDSSAIVPATARGIQELFSYYSISLIGKKVAVVGRSRLVGTPVAILCKKAGADVIICHSKTVDLAHETKQADIVVVAVGKPGLIGAEHLKQGAVVIDVGISNMPDGSLKGDVDVEAVKNIVSAITPVPGGVGPMTVLGLFENLVDASVSLASYG